MAIVPDALQPRDRVSAARTMLLAAVISLIATAAWEVNASSFGRVSSTPATTMIAIGVAALVLVPAVAAYRAPCRVPAWVYPATPVVATVAVAVIAIISGDGSAAGQYGLVYPVLYAASQHRRAFAWGVTALAVVADAVVVLTQLPLAEALGDLLMVGPSLAMVTAVLLASAVHQERLTERLNLLATTDPLTGLATRRELERVAEGLLTGPADSLGRRATDRLDATAPVGVSLVLLDLDRFKELNDTHGHPAGDKALVQLARMIRSAVRSTDTVARLGGDELAILLAGEPQGVLLRARAIHSAIRAATLLVDGHAVRLTASVGVACGRVGSATFADLYAAADAALYEAKAAGRDRLAHRVLDAGLLHGVPTQPSHVTRS